MQTVPTQRGITFVDDCSVAAILGLRRAADITIPIAASVSEILPSPAPPPWTLSPASEPRVLDDVVDLRQRQGDVVLVDVAVVPQRLRDALAHLPDRLDLGGLRGHGAVL